MRDVTCEVCGIVFQVQESRFWRGGRAVNVRYHDLNCRAIADKRNETRVCPVDGTVFHVSKGTMFKGVPQRFCSRSCSNYSKPHKISMTAHIRSDGYMELRMPGHPKAHNGRVLEHVVVAENKLGRPLRDDEQVHHRNGNKRDNRPANLQVLTASEHSKLHQSARELNPPSERWRKNWLKQPDTTPAP